jgi:hypothetical protein
MVAGNVGTQQRSEACRVHHLVGRCDRCTRDLVPVPISLENALIVSVDPLLVILCEISSVVPGTVSLLSHSGKERRLPASEARCGCETKGCLSSALNIEQPGSAARSLSSIGEQA